MSRRQRTPREEQRFRNLVTVAVIGSIVLVIAILYAVLLAGDTGVVGALCSVGFLAVAFVAWEYLMKPGYGVLHRPRDFDEEEEPRPESPRPP